MPKQGQGPAPTEEQVQNADKVIADYMACLDKVDSKESSCSCIKTYFHKFTVASKILINHDRSIAITEKDHQIIDEAEKVVTNPNRKKSLQRCLYPE